MIPSVGEKESIESASKTCEGILFVQLIGPLTLQLFLRGAMKSIWPLYMTLQVLSLYSLLALKIPSNVLLMQDSYNNLISLNFIPKEFFM